MSILDIDVSEKCDVELLNSIFKLWLEQRSSYFESCGMTVWKNRSWFDIKKLPDDYLDWILCRCRGLNNRAKYSCIITNKETCDKLDIYDPFSVMSCYHGYIPMKVSHLLRWYNNRNNDTIYI